jgi:hypothetical protein
VRVRTKERSVDPSIAFRKHAVWLFPSAFLIHSLMLYGIYRPFAQPSLALVAIAAVSGFLVRWVRRAAVVQALAIFIMAFLLLYVLGLLGPIAYLVVANHREWIAVSGGAIAGLMVSMLVVRVRASLRLEWSESLDVSPGVVLSPSTHTLVRYPVERPGGFLGKSALVLLGPLIVLLVIARGTTWYMFVAMFVGPLCGAYFCAEIVARAIAFYIVTRRWELTHRVKLVVPPLR